VAKVVLTVRDPQRRWYGSSRDPIFQFPIRRRGLAERFAFGMVVRLNPRSVDIPLMPERVVWDRMFGGRRADRTAAIEWFPPPCRRGEGARVW
jgi:hypothetical protein